MRLLLDTHIWLWALQDARRLSRRVDRALRDPANELWLSPLSVWEFLLLVEGRRLRLDGDPLSWVAEAFRRSPMREAPLTHEIALASRAVDLPHRDPVDRFLAATATVLGLTLVTADERLLGASGLATLANR
ncbi:MAG: type II toxin-antitoxin system VapC family toxin [Planctomycetes bacterium]|nr:type II toxin-antitoxin system VapC family toxin [Planctomycetota bacterium]